MTCTKMSALEISIGVFLDSSGITVKACTVFFMHHNIFAIMLLHESTSILKERHPTPVEKVNWHKFSVVH